MAEKAFGTTIGIGSADLSGIPTYTTIASVRDAGSLALSKVMADVTAHDSLGGHFEQIPSGKQEAIEIPLVLVFDQDEATHDNASGGILYAHLQETLLAYKITYPDATNWIFDAYVSKFEFVVGDGSEALMAKVSLALTSVNAAPAYATS